MLNRELYSIRWDEMVKLSKGEISDLLYGKSCVCTHLSGNHMSYTLNVPAVMEQQIVFIDCKAYSCECPMFKRDNLRYLEDLSNE